MSASSRASEQSQEDAERYLAKEEIRRSFKVHELIAKVSRDHCLYETMARLYERLQLFVWLDALYEGDADLTRKEHAELIDVVLSGDVKRATRFAEAHVERSQKNVRRKLARRASA